MSMHRSKTTPPSRHASVKQTDDRPRTRKKARKDSDQSVPAFTDGQTMLSTAILRALTSMIAHEINQPLAAIVTNANAGLRWLTRPRPDIAEVRRLLGRIVDEGHRASGLVAAIRSKIAEPHKEPGAVSVSDVIAD